MDLVIFITLTKPGFLLGASYRTESGSKNSSSMQHAAVHVRRHIMCMMRPFKVSLRHWTCTSERVSQYTWLSPYVQYLGWRLSSDCGFLAAVTSSDFARRHSLQTSGLQSHHGPGPDD